MSIVLFAIIGLLFKTSKPIIAEAFESDDNVWTTDDTNFAYAFQTGCPDPTCKEGQIYYMHGPIFFSKQFKKSDHQRIQNICKKNWNQYLIRVSLKKVPYYFVCIIVCYINKHTFVKTNPHTY